MNLKNAVPRAVTLPRQIRHAPLIAATLFFSPTIAHAVPVTLGTLSGSWDLRTACMNNSGKPGACIEMKSGSLQFTFSPDGKWTSEASDENKTNKAGTYEVHGTRLILKISDGTIYQNWQADLIDNGKHLVVNDKKLIETLERLTSAQ